MELEPEVIKLIGGMLSYVLINSSDETIQAFETLARDMAAKYHSGDSGDSGD